MPAKKPAKGDGRTRKSGAPRPPPPVPTTPSEYEAWRAKMTPQEQRVDEIVSMMSRGAWMCGVSTRELAVKWGVHPSTVEHLSAEANRLLRYHFRTDPESKKDLTALVLQNFEVIRVKALADATPAGLRVALDATRALGFYLGLEPARRLAVEETPESDTEFVHEDGTRWSPEELDDFAKSGRRPRRALRRMAAAALLPEANGNGADDGDEPNGVH